MGNGGGIEVRCGVRPGEAASQIFYTWSHDKNHEAGWLAGVTDGEGSLVSENRKGTTLSIAQKPGLVGDVVKPLKRLLPDYQKLERRLEIIILKRYGLPIKLEPEVKEADLIALATEKRDLLYDGHIWEATKGITPWPEEIVPWLPPVAKEQFLKRFYALCKQPLR